MEITSCSATKHRLTVLVIATLLARGAAAQATPRQPAAPTPIGTWRGTSLCLVRPSACHDEVVVYRIAPTKSADSVTLDARKIVRGQEEEMGVFVCQFMSKNGSLTCGMRLGTWRFRIRGDSLVGDLRLGDNTKFRDVRTARAP